MNACTDSTYINLGQGADISPRERTQLSSEVCWVGYRWLSVGRSAAQVSRFRRPVSHSLTSLGVPSKTQSPDPRAAYICTDTSTGPARSPAGTFATVCTFCSTLDMLWLHSAMLLSTIYHVRSWRALLQDAPRKL